MNVAAVPLRIGIITDGLEERRVDGAFQVANGGVGVYIYNLIKHLRSIDAVNQYFLIRWGAGHLDVYDPEGGRNVFLPTSPLTPIARLLDLPYRRLVADLKLDLLHYPNQFGGAFLPSEIRRVVTLHDVTAFLLPQHHPRARVWHSRLLMRRSLRSAHHVIAVSAHTRADLLARRLVSESKVTVIPQGVTAVFRPGLCTTDLAQRYALPARFILCVGVLEPRKNHIVLIEALRRLRAAGESIGLVFVGRDGWGWRSPLDDPTIRDLHPFIRVFRNVPDADLPQFYNRAAVFAYPSLYEGFGLPVIEAMACGVPVVAARSSSLPEVAGEAALYADPHDAQEFTACFLELLRDPLLRDRLIAAGQRRAADLSWHQTAAQTLAVYQRVCTPTPA